MRNEAPALNVDPALSLLDDAVSFHQALAEKWEQKYRKKSFAARQKILRECLKEIDLKGKTWLDAGCGTGTLARYLAEQGCTVEAVDAAPEMLHVASRLVSEACKSAEITFRRVRSIEALPFPSRSFDGVLCSSVLEYVFDPHACVEELSRVLGPEGVLLISVPNARSVVRRLLRTTHRCTAALGQPWPKYLTISKHHYSVSEFRHFLQTHGLKPEKSVPFGSPLARLSGSELFSSLLMFRCRKAGR